MEYIDMVRFNANMMLWMYYIPTALCLVGYFIKTCKEFVRDREDRERYDRLTYGEIILRLLGSFTPVLNILCVVLDLSKYFFKFLSMPVVPSKHN